MGKPKYLNVFLLHRLSVITYLDTNLNLLSYVIQLRYKRWLWWTRFATVVTVVQFLLAMYLLFVVGNNTSNDCALGKVLFPLFIQKYTFNFLKSNYGVFSFHAD